MAVQSYFLNLLPPGVSVIHGANGRFIFNGSSTLNTIQLSELLRSGPGIRLAKYEEGWRQGFIVNDHLLVIPSITNEGGVKEILIEGSLSWYPEGLDDLTEVLTRIESTGPLQYVLPDGRIIDFDSRESFLQEVRHFFDSKHMAFCNLFPNTPKRKIDSEHVLRRSRFFSSWFGKLLALMGIERKSDRK
jgi:hypothetical protein